MVNEYASACNLSIASVVLSVKKKIKKKSNLHIDEKTERLLNINN